MRVVLIGFMGSGKTTVARLVAARLNLPLCEMDDLIIRRSGLPSVNAIFERGGEAEFRDFESAVSKEVAETNDIVVSTGGGVITRDENMTALKGANKSPSDAVIVYLRTSFETLQVRIAALDERPLFKKAHEARELYARRVPVYERWADIVVDTDDKSPEEACEAILANLTDL